MDSERMDSERLDTTIDRTSELQLVVTNKIGSGALESVKSFFRKDLSGDTLFEKFSECVEKFVEASYSFDEFRLMLAENGREDINYSSLINNLSIRSKFAMTLKFDAKNWYVRLYVIVKMSDEDQNLSHKNLIAHDGGLAIQAKPDEVPEFFHNQVGFKFYPHVNNKDKVWLKEFFDCTKEKKGVSSLSKKCSAAFIKAKSDYANFLSSLFKPEVSKPVEDMGSIEPLEGDSVKSKEVYWTPSKNDNRRSSKRLSIAQSIQPIQEFLEDSRVEEIPSDHKGIDKKVETGGDDENIYDSDIENESEKLSKDDKIDRKNDSPDENHSITEDSANESDHKIPSDSEMNVTKVDSDEDHFSVSNDEAETPLESDDDYDEEKATEDVDMIKDGEIDNTQDTVDFASFERTLNAKENRMQRDSYKIEMLDKIKSSIEFYLRTLQGLATKKENEVDFLGLIAKIFPFLKDQRYQRRSSRKRSIENDDIEREDSKRILATSSPTIMINQLSSAPTISFTLPLHTTKNILDTIVGDLMSVESLHTTRNTLDTILPLTSVPPSVPPSLPPSHLKTLPSSSQIIDVHIPLDVEKLPLDVEKLPSTTPTTPRRSPRLPSLPPSLPPSNLKTLPSSSQIIDVHTPIDVEKLPSTTPTTPRKSPRVNSPQLLDMKKVALGQDKRNNFFEPNPIAIAQRRAKEDLVLKSKEAAVVIAVVVEKVESKSAIENKKVNRELAHIEERKRLKEMVHSQSRLKEPVSIRVPVAIAEAKEAVSIGLPRTENRFFDFTQKCSIQENFRRKKFEQIEDDVVTSHLQLMNRYMYPQSKPSRVYIFQVSFYNAVFYQLEDSSKTLSKEVLHSEADCVALDETDQRKLFSEKLTNLNTFDDGIICHDGALKFIREEFDMIIQPMYFESHWMLGIISRSEKKIVFCDSILYMTQQHEKNLMTLAKFLFPEESFSFVELPSYLRFQEISKGYLDCGYFLLYYASAALQRVQIDNSKKAFQDFKNQIHSRYDPWDDHCSLYYTVGQEKLIHFPWANNSCALDTTLTILWVIYEMCKTGNYEEHGRCMTLEFPPLEVYFGKLYSGEVSNIAMKKGIQSMLKIDNRDYQIGEFVNLYLITNFVKDNFFTPYDRSYVKPLFFEWTSKTEWLCNNCGMTIESEGSNNTITISTSSDTVQNSLDNFFGESSQSKSCKCKLGSEKMRFIKKNIFYCPIILHITYDTKNEIVSTPSFLDATVKLLSNFYDLVGAVYGNGSHFIVRYRRNKTDGTSACYEADGMNRNTSGKYFAESVFINLPHQLAFAKNIKKGDYTMIDVYYIRRIDYYYEKP